MCVLARVRCHACCGFALVCDPCSVIVLAVAAVQILHGTGTRNWDLAGPKPESDSWFLIPAGIPEFGYSGY